MTKSPHPSSVDKGELLPVTQDRRRVALIERLGTFADLLCQEPLPGASGDVAYDLVRQAAAQIASDRLHIERQAHSLPGDVGRLVRAARAVVEEYGERRSDTGEMFSAETQADPKIGELIAALTTSALSGEQQWGGLLEDGLCDDHGQFMCPKCRYPVPSQQGTEP